MGGNYLQKYGTWIYAHYMKKQTFLDFRGFDFRNFGFYAAYPICFLFSTTTSWGIILAKEQLDQSNFAQKALY